VQPACKKKFKVLKRIERLDRFKKSKFNMFDLEEEFRDRPRRAR
jgi:hypothetical protein